MEREYNNAKNGRVSVEVIQDNKHKIKIALRIGFP